MGGSKVTNILKEKTTTTAEMNCPHIGEDKKYKRTREDEVDGMMMRGKGLVKGSD